MPSLNFLNRFLCHIVNENQATTDYRPAVNGKAGINKIRFGLLEDHYDHVQLR